MVLLPSSSLLPALTALSKKATADDAAGYVTLRATVNKIPTTKSLAPKRVRLPHSIYADSDVDICVIVPNRQKELELKLNESPSISKVITVKELETIYKTYQSRRQLASSFDAFYCDKRISEAMLRLLGTAFIKSKKLPISVNLQRSNPVQSIERARECTAFTLAYGLHQSIRIGDTTMTPKVLLENAQAGFHGLCNFLPGSAKNVSMLHLCHESYPALPVYVAQVSKNDLAAALALTPVNMAGEVIGEDAPGAQPSSKRTMYFVETVGVNPTTLHMEKPLLIGEKAKDATEDDVTEEEKKVVEEAEEAEEESKVVTKVVRRRKKKVAAAPATEATETSVKVKKVKKVKRKRKSA